ncbi:hypothetical protein FLBR109950_10535 [Flavobacterium branchiophilum]|uniref:Uncharacterized protein n=1 Tax=Flavobacterium branchiophilum (strain FL-15) TaxID=1034807 RepID=G2Z588_FLABF|nr:hypothetical protein [Flavobacterium branchiophilum]CCB68594.1 Protein of unknown function precursor [Flavobacterium branchiophilum FL-15]
MKKIYCSIALCSALLGWGQTDNDALMMDKNNLCIGTMFQHESWDRYWEGTFKRDNLNLGTVTHQSFGIMGNYGVSSKLNLLFGLPYVTAKASAGTLAGQKGFQDLTLMAKYMPIETTIGNNTYSLYTLVGFSVPVSNYPADYLPLSLGLRSKTATFRVMADFQRHHFFSTISGAFMYRNNITIDREAYYTTTYHYTNEVKMPNAIQTQLRMGYRSDYWIAELLWDNMITQTGFDISTNNMPFPSNTMNASRVGINWKYTFKKISGLSITGGSSYVVSGRNVGQTLAYNIGAFYIINFSKSIPNENKTN